MLYLVIIYLSGVLFFATQAMRYSRLFGPRLAGALVWPVGLWWLPGLVRNSLKMSRDNRLSGYSLAGVAWGGSGGGPDTAWWGIGL